MDVKSAIETGDATALRRLLAEDPSRANTLIVWGTRGEIRTHPLHYVSDMRFNGTLDRARALPLVDALIDAGANVNHDDLAGRCETPLIGAASLGAEEVGARLLAAGASPNRLGLFGETALHWAAMIGAERLVGDLLHRGSLVNLKDERYQSTPLGWALHGWGDQPPGNDRRHHEVVALLIEAGAQVEPAMLESPKVLADADMRSALHRGVRT